MSKVLTMSGEIKFSGDVGPRGIQGIQGEKPVKGVDYYTEADKAEIVEDVTGTAITEFNVNATEKTEEFNTNASTKTNTFNTNASTKTNTFNTNASTKTNTFNSSANTKTTTFNLNATTKTTEFNTNAENKTTAFNENASTQTSTFDDNATGKTTSFNINAIAKTTAFNTNATEKTNTFDTNVTNKTNAFNENATTKTTSFNSNATSKTTEFNTNASTKTSAFDSNATSKTTAYNDNATAKTTAFNSNYDEKLASFNSSANVTKIKENSNILIRAKNGLLKGTSSDTFINLTDGITAEYEELSVDGVCEQTVLTGKNICSGFDKNVMLSTSTGIASENVGNYYTTDYIPVDYSNDNKYTLSSNIDSLYCLIWAYNSNKEAIKRTGATIGTAKRITDTTTFANGTGSGTSDTTIAYVRIHFYPNANATGSIGFDNGGWVQFEKNSNATSYEPYTGGQPSPSPDYPQPISVIENSLKVTSCGKNLLPNNATTKTESGITFTIKEDKAVFVSGTATSIVDCYMVGNATEYVSLGVTGNYYISGCNSNSTSKYMFYVVQKNASGNLSYYQNISGYTPITISKGDTFRIFIRVLNGQTVSDTVKPMISSNQDIYEQHQETSVTATLGTEFIGKINDTYKDTLKAEFNEADGYYHLKLYKKVGKVVLDGSEANWQYNSTYNYFYIQYYSFAKEPLTINNDNRANYSQLCNCLIVNKVWSSYRDNTTVQGEFYIVQKTGYRICLRNTNYTDVNDLKTWLSTHNAIIYYPLETPYTVDLGVINMPISYENVTNIFTNSDLTPKITADYYKNINELYTAIGDIGTILDTVNGEVI